MKAIQEEGLDAELSAVIPPSVEARAVNELLGKELIEQLKEKSVIIGKMKSGVMIKLHNENIILDVSDSAILELLTGYIRKDFQQLFFEINE